MGGRHRSGETGDPENNYWRIRKATELIKLSLWILWEVIKDRL